MSRKNRTKYASFTPFVIVFVLTAGLVLLLAQVSSLTPYLPLGGVACVLFGGWAYLVVLKGAALVETKGREVVSLFFQVGVSLLKFLLLLLMLLLYYSVFAPPDRAFAWYLLITFLPFFIYETWAFYGMSQRK